jgi:hypothetical protein
MSSPLSLPPIAPVHHDDAVNSLAYSQPKTMQPHLVTNEPIYISSTVALSFAFDSVTKSLNVVMTDKTSGEVVRKVTYKHLPQDVHQPNKLHGLLLDQFA